MPLSIGGTIWAVFQCYKQRGRAIVRLIMSSSMKKPVEQVLEGDGCARAVSGVWIGASVKQGSYRRGIVVSDGGKEGLIQVLLTQGNMHAPGDATDNGSEQCKDSETETSAP